MANSTPRVCDLISHLPQAKKKEKFLAALSKTGKVNDAAVLAGVGFRTAYDWRAQDEDFRSAWESIHEEQTVALEESLYNRAVSSDTIAAIFLLKARRPAMYREVIRQENLNVNVSASLDRLDRELTDGQLSDLLAVVEAKRAALGPGTTTSAEVSEVVEVSAEVPPEAGW